jgi:hypothetical protein
LIVVQSVPSTEAKPPAHVVAAQPGKPKAQKRKSIAGAAPVRGMRRVARREGLAATICVGAMREGKGAVVKLSCVRRSYISTSRKF